MKKILKKIYMILAVIVVLAVLAVVAIGAFAGRGVKIAIETAATRALNVGVSVEDVDISILGGEIGFEKLVINNPPGYQYSKLLKLQKAEIKVDVRSLLKDTIKVREIRLDGVEVVLEQRGVSGNNLQDVIKGMSGEAKPKDKSEKAAKKIHVGELEITNVTVKAKLLPVPGKADTIPLELAPIRMSNLGSDDKLTAAALSSKILLAIAKGIAEKGAGKLPDEMVSTITSELKRLGALSGVFLQEGGKIFKEGADIGEGIVEGLKGLLKPKEDKQEKQD